MRDHSGPHTAFELRETKVEAIQDNAEEKSSLKEEEKASFPYRPDIDGLRAFAVLSVVFYHMEKTWIPGGPHMICITHHQ